MVTCGVDQGSYGVLAVLYCCIFAVRTLHAFHLRPTTTTTACTVRHSAYSLTSGRHQLPHLKSNLNDQTTDVGTTNTNMKEELFVKWMTSDDVWDEIPHPGKKLRVIGSIPSYVQGRYIKNGPGAFATPDKSRRYTHAFDGFARLQKFDIETTGDVTFTTRYIDSSVYRAVREENKIPGHLSVGPVVPPFSYLDIVLNTFNFDNTCVNVADVSGTFVAVTDADVMNEIDPTTLETIRTLPKRKIQGTSGLTTFSTAHGKTSRKTGLSYNFHMDIGIENWAHIVRTDADLTKTSIGKVKVGGQFSYVHEISMTENYVVLVLCPALVDMAAAVQTKSLLPTLRFDPTVPTQICLFDLEGTKPVQTFEAPALWTFHHVNAFEDEHGAVLLDLIAYETAAIANGPHGYLYMDNMADPATRNLEEREGQVWRFTLDPKSTEKKMLVPEKKVILDTTSGKEVTIELTSVSPDVLGLPYRYVYGFTGFYQGEVGYIDWAIYKQDVVKNENAGVWYEEFSYPGEVTFVQNPAGREEDDGVLLSTVYDSRQGQNFLLVLDARTMKETARAYTGVACPQSFHGKFYPY